MGFVVAVIAQGSMGAGVGKRLHESGAEVRTLLGGRSAKSAERARAAGMIPAGDEKTMLDGADFFLSKDLLVTPAAFRQRLQEFLGQSRNQPNTQ